MDAVSELKRLGLSGYEAKVYVALVAAGEPLVGYEVAKRSGVPRSTVYETLSKLVARSVAYEVRADSDQVAYIPAPPKTLFSRIRDETEEAIENLRSTLDNVTPKATVHYSHTLPSRDDILGRCRDLIVSASTDLLLIAFPEELAPLEPPLRRAYSSGVDVFVAGFGADGEQSYGQAFSHATAPADELAEDTGCRLFVLVADRQELVVAGFTDDGAWGAFTDDPAIVMMASEFARIDISIQEFIKRHAVEHVPQWRLESEAIRNMIRGGSRKPVSILRRLNGGRETSVTDGEIAGRTPENRKRRTPSEPRQTPGKKTNR
ncbi:TrmB family transcriptional regulator [Streptomyces acidicola]|uniref:TrmB family transcriptional regulator n=1 Tax=Streptomyces acidicola TaxID=2596892 RepID=UPI00380AD6DF